MTLSSMNITEQQLTHQTRWEAGIYGLTGREVKLMITLTSTFDVGDTAEFKSVQRSVTVLIDT